MTLDGLSQAVATELGEQYGDLDIALQFQAWGQEIYEEVVGSARWFFKNGESDVTPLAGISVYTLPTTISEVRTAYVTSSPPSRVSYSPVERILARGDDLLGAGRPKAWFYAGIDTTTTAHKIRLWPVPDAAFVALGVVIRLETLLRPGTLASTDTIPLPTEYIRVLKEGVRYRALFNDGDLEAAKASFSRFSSGLDELNSRYHGQESGGSALKVKRLKAARQSPGTTEEG